MNMKKILAMLLALAVLFSLAACDPKQPDTNTTSPSKNPPAQLPAGQTFTVTSPDQNLQVDMVLDNFGQLGYRVVKKGVEVLAYSSLGFVTETEDFSQFLELEAQSSEEINHTYSNMTGRHEVVENHCNQINLTFKNANYTFYLDVQMRAYDDGYGFRYSIRAMDGSEGTLKVLEEKSQFALPADSITWLQEYKTNLASGNFFSYEESYQRRNGTKLAGRYISLPMLYQVGETDMYSLITESGLIGSGYYGSFLKEVEDQPGSAVLQTVQSPAGCQKDGDVISYPFTSPWRVASVGTLAEVVESEIVEKVYDDVEYWKPDNYDTLSDEEKAVYTYDWVDPDVTAWNWLAYTGEIPQSDYNLHRSYIDLAVEMGWKYIILDGGWSSGLDYVMFQEFMDYADSKGVKVIAWFNALNDFSNGNKKSVTNILEKWSEFGIAGIKIDFFDGQNATGQTFQGEDIDMIDYYEWVYQECARLKLLVNCHGANKPTGERREYPHVINREGIRGNEFKNINSTITVNQLFVRNNVGPCDFTPVVNPYTDGLTMGQQMALAVLFESGNPSMADRESAYDNDLIRDFYRAIPDAWTDMKFLEGELDKYYIAATKDGDDWFVGGANSIMETSTSVSFSFLDEGTYTAIIYTDAADGKNVERTEMTVTAEDKIDVSMMKNGGFVIHLVKQ